MFDITNIYINVLYKDIKTGSAHVTLLDITNLYKQDAVTMIRYSNVKLSEKPYILDNIRLDSNIKLALKQHVMTK